MAPSTKPPALNSDSVFFLKYYAVPHGLMTTLQTSFPMEKMYVVQNNWSKTASRTTIQNRSYRKNHLRPTRDTYETQLKSFNSVQLCRSTVRKNDKSSKADEPTSGYL